MNRLTKLIAPALAASLALGAAVPASAATAFSGAGSVRVELAHLDRQIDIAKARHQLSYREAASLERQVDQLQRLFRIYSRNGLSRGELRILDNKINAVKRDLAHQTHDFDRHPGDRDDGFGHKGDDGHRR